MSQREARIEEGARSALLQHWPSDLTQPFLDALRANNPHSSVFDMLGSYPVGTTTKHHNHGTYIHHEFYRDATDVVDKEQVRCLKHNEGKEIDQYLVPYGIPVVFRYDPSGGLVEAYTIGDGFKGMDIINAVRKLPTLPTNMRIPAMRELLGVPFGLEVWAVLTCENGDMNALYNLLLERGKSQEAVLMHVYRIKVDGEEVTDAVTLERITSGGLVVHHGLIDLEGDEVLCPVKCVKRIMYSKDVTFLVNKARSKRIEGWLNHRLHHLHEDGPIAHWNRNAFVLVTQVTGDQQASYMAHVCHSEAKAELYGVDWVVLNDRILRPVLEVSPISLCGDKVTDVLSEGTGFNNVALGRGDHLTIERFPYMMPQVAACEQEDDSDTIELPDACPACKTQPLRSIGAGLRCINRMCKSTLVRRIHTFLNRLRVVGLTEYDLKKLVDSGKVGEVQDLYCLSEDDFAALFGGSATAGHEIVGNLFSTIPDSAEDLFDAALDGCTDTHAVAFSTLLEERGAETSRATCEEHFQKNGLTDLNEAYDMWMGSFRLVSEMLTLSGE